MQATPPLRNARRFKPKQLAELCDLIYEGPLEAKPWQRFLDRLRELTQVTRISIQLHREADAARDLRVATTHPANPLDWAEVLEAYRQGPIDRDPIRHHQLRPGQIVTLDECLGSDFHQQFLAPRQIVHLVRACFTEPGGMRCWLQMYGHAANGPFDKDRDVMLLRKLLPHLERALQLYARIMRNQSEKLTYQEAIAHLAFGSLVLDGERRVIESNPIALHLIEKHAGIVLTEGRLSLEDPDRDADLQAAISGALELRKTQSAGTHVDLVRMPCDCGALIGFLVLSTPLIHFYQGERTPNVIIYMCDLGERIGDHKERQLSAQQLVSKLFNVTRAEARLAVHLADGLSLAESADAMHITESSARNYSKRIYDKTGIKGQADLVRLVYKSVAMLGAAPVVAAAHPRACIAADRTRRTRQARPALDA